MHLYRRFFSAILLSSFFLSPPLAQAALNASQINSILDLLTAFNADAATVARVRATLMGSAAPAAGTLWFGVGTQPTETEISRNATNIPFTTITLTNNSTSAATIYTITVERAGSASDSSVRTIKLLQDSTAIASTNSFDSRHQATLALNDFVVPAGATIHLTLTGDLSNKARSNKTVGLTVVALNASSPISGVLPLVGTLQKID